LQIANADAKRLHLLGPDGPSLTLKELPYPVVLEREDKPPKQ